jgi:hypothetical protein
VSAPVALKCSQCAAPLDAVTFGCGYCGTSFVRPVLERDIRAGDLQRHKELCAQYADAKCDELPDFYARARRFVSRRL